MAKTTIYRHWTSRAALLVEACSTIRTAPQPPDSGSLVDDLTVLATQLADQLCTAKWATVLPSIIDAAEREPDLAQLHAGLHAQLMSPFALVIERAWARGEATSEWEPTEVAASIAGPIFYRRWFSREPLDEPFVKRTVRDAIEKA